MGKKIIFLDRDGTLIVEPKDNFQIDSLEKLRFEPGAIPALLRLVNFGFELVLVSNQDGLGRASFPTAAFEGPQEKMLEILRSCGLEFRDIFICPHFAEDHCECRKPRTGLLTDYLKYKLYDPQQSFMIGDRASDMELAERLGVRGLLYPQQGWGEIAEEILGSFRCASVNRKTKETQVEASVRLNGGRSEILTGVEFFDHMLMQIAVHSGIGLRLRCEGDLGVDEHHSVEDTALALGEALRLALGDKVGIARYGFALPMDESRAACELDFSGRPVLVFRAKFKKKKLGQLSTELIEHFFYSLGYAMGASLHLRVRGKNDHHKAEALFKAFAKALKMAVKIEDETLPSSKGVL